MTRPFLLLEEEAALSLLRTADVLAGRAANLLRRFDITGAQYNVLRILHGSPDGLGCGQISERLVAQDPDVTRLLDRMEARHWIARKRSCQDRRVVRACLTAAGLTLLETVTPLIVAYHREQFLDWEAGELKQLIELLEKIREVEPKLPTGDEVK